MFSSMYRMQTERRQFFPHKRARAPGQAIGVLRAGGTLHCQDLNRNQYLIGKLADLYLTNLYGDHPCPPR